MVELTQETLKQLLHYNPDSGVFTWKYRGVEWFSGDRPEWRQAAFNTTFSKKSAGNISKQRGYLQIGLLGKLYLAHRLAWLYIKGEMPEEIDHIDQNRLNCKFDNLRVADRCINQQNTSMRCDNNSGFTGINWHKCRGMWAVRLQFNNKRISGGYFHSIEDAIVKRTQMNLEYGFSINHGRKKC